MPNSVVVNMGNVIQKWTNNYLKSAVHRVLESDTDSFTTAYFMYPPKDHKLHQIGPQAQQEDYPMSIKQFLTLFDKTKQAIKEKHGR
jgi:isopenicillin N synthase-like dioxygenase